MKIILLILIIAVAGCSAPHAIDDSNNINSEQAANSKKNESSKLSPEDIQRAFLVNLVNHHVCDPTILDDFTYMYNSNTFGYNGFYYLYFTPFKNYFTPHKFFLSYYSAYLERGWSVNEYVSQYANPYTPAPLVGFQKNVLTKGGLLPDDMSKYLTPVIPARYNSGYASNAVINRHPIENNTATFGQNGGNNKLASAVFEKKQQFENDIRPVNTYVPPSLINDNNQNNFHQNQAMGSVSSGSGNNSNRFSGKGSEGNTLPR